MTSKGTVGGFIFCFILIFLVSMTNIMQSIDIHKLKDSVKSQEHYIQEIEKDVDNINDVLTGGLELGMFTATYYCA